MVLLEPHVSGMNSLRITPAEKHRKEPRTRKEIPNQEAHHASRPEMRAASQQSEDNKTGTKQKRRSENHAA